MTSAVEDVASTDTDMSSATGSSNASSPAQPDERKTSVPGDGESDEEGEVSSSEDENASSNKGPAARQAGQKRPADESSPTSTSLRADADVAAAVNKRVKLTPLHDALQTGDWRTDYRDQEGRLLKDFSKLPAQIWTHIFTYAPPSTLADLSKISRGFRNLLVSTGPVDTSSGPPVTGGVLKPLAPDSVWALSRKLYYPSMPVPLEKQSEFDMWNLLERRKCQFCGKSGQDASEASPGLPWEPALGDDGVKIIWPFGVRSCGACLVKHSEKVSSVLPCAGMIHSENAHQRTTGDATDDLIFDASHVTSSTPVHLSHPGPSCHHAQEPPRCHLSPATADDQILSEITYRGHQGPIGGGQVPGPCGRRGVVQGS